ncbi:hypothetical protein [Pseudomonas sp. PA15(2017)]|uniref:hypothetical protein n=1 Tax=Pseudomonas sp. PA15(2017) TaxID=1932111 RepID=UPI00117AE458|nr:hypothetical protein [Pseudomonas sp. PA15(2017)]
MPLQGPILAGWVEQRIDVIDLFFPGTLLDHVSADLAPRILVSFSQAAPGILIGLAERSTGILIALAD